MNIRIEPKVAHESYTVNGKEVYKDGNGNWICSQEFCQKERNAFANYKKTVIENPAFKRHGAATYKSK